MFVGTALACLKFNKGAAAVFDILQRILSTMAQLEAADRCNKKRLYQSSSARMAKKIRSRYEKERKSATAYNSGGF